MKIEQKERERIEKTATEFGESFKTGEFFEKIRIEAGIYMAEGEHLHLQKEVIQPKDKRIQELEAEIGTLRDDLKSLQERQPEINREALSVAIAEAEEEFEVKNKQRVTELESNLYKLEAEIKALREAAINIMTATRNTEQKAYEAMHKLLTKNEG